MSTALLSAQGVSRRFGRRVGLHSIDFDVRAGEIVVLAGPNGAGKSTLLAILAGALEPSSGRVEHFDGSDTGWAPQRPGHYARLSPRENIELFARLIGSVDARAVASRLLKEFELVDDGARAGDLSVGNRQRLNLALALVGDPAVLLLDEPTAALDARQRRLLWERLDRLAGTGRGIVVATQSSDELERAERVLVLVEGHLAFHGHPAELPDSSVAAVLT